MTQEAEHIASEYISGDFQEAAIEIILMQKNSTLATIAHLYILMVNFLI